MHALIIGNRALIACCAARQVNYKEPTPPEADLVVRSAVVKIRDTADVGSGKTSVQVDLALCLVQPAGQEKLLASATGIFKKLGALRAL